MVELAAIQASVTHDTVDGVEAAQAAALMAHYSHHNLGTKSDLRRFLVGQLGSRWAIPHVGPVSNNGMTATNAALTAIETSQTLQDTLIASVAFTGDVDTVAAIAMAVAPRLLPEDAIQLPHSLVEGLESGEYGAGRLRMVDEVLFTLGLVDG